MKNYISKFKRMFAVILMAGVAAFGAYAQNSVAAPGSGGSFTPNNGGGGGSFGPPNGIGWNPGPMAPPAWGNPWGPSWNNGPSIVVNPVTVPSQGITKVVACGYDAQGIWRVLPLTVSYQYNGVQYVVNVINAWNPWTDRWDRGVDVPAYDTDYYLRGNTYDYYCVLPTGTFYFNL